jgi:hypothetical protein
MAKKILYILGAVLLFLPLFQQIVGIPKIKGLSGAIEEKALPSVTWNNWNSNEYQDSLEAFLNQKFGFRNSFVRINNQFAFSLFNEAKAQDVIIGKQNFLYELNYIKAYYGTDFIGQEAVDSLFYKLSKITDTLQTYGCHVIPIFAIGKASFFPEFIPDALQTEKQKTNYEAYIEQCKMYELNYIDFHAHYRSVKGKTHYPIYTKYGIHWTQNTMVDVADSILGYVSKIMNFTVPRIHVTERKESFIMKGTDNDIARGMNLIYYSSDSILAYPNFTYTQTDTALLPKAITVADSYWWGIYNYGIPQNSFKNHEFWYYFSTAYPSQKTISELDIQNILESQDIIFILGTDATINKFGWGFIEEVYKIYFLKNKD